MDTHHHSSSRQQPPKPADPTVSTSKFTLEQLTRLLLRVSTDFYAVDLFNDELLRLSPEVEKPPADTRSRPAVSNKRRPLWVLLVRGLYLYTTARILMYICLQYVYDINWYKYESLLRESGLQLAATATAMVTTTSTSTTTTTNGGSYKNISDDNSGGIGVNIANASCSDGEHELQLLEQRIERDIGRLKFVGAPFIKFHFGIGLVYIHLSWVVFIVYIRPQLYFRYVKPFDFSLLRAMVDWEREQVYCDKIVRHEVRKFCVSNRIFVQFPHLFWPSGGGNGHSSYGSSFKSNRLLANLGRTSEQLNQMALDGSLRPLNRSPAWIKHTSHWLGHVCLWILVGHLILVVSLIYLMQSHLLELAAIETTPMDLVSIVETIIFAAIAVISVNLYLTVTAFNTLDQIRTVNELNRLIHRCIRFNTRTFERIQAVCGGRFLSEFALAKFAAPMDAKENRRRRTQPELAATTKAAAATITIVTPTSHHQSEDHHYDERATAREISQCYAQMDNNLLFVVMSYKIFVSQTKSTRSYSAFTLFTTAELMIFGPVISLLSAQYLTTSMLYIVVGFCLSFIVWGDLSMAPSCYFYSRSLEIYRSLHSLLAHTVALRCEAASTVDLYDSHTILVLRKELSQPDQLLNQFATTLLGVRFTYTNFLKIHFWCGILAMVGYYTSGPNKGGVFEETMKFF